MRTPLGRATTVIAFTLLLGGLFARSASADPASALLERYAVLAPRLSSNAFNQPIVLESSETGGRLSGDIYAVIDFPFEAVSAGLNNPQHWCDVMLLHTNTKYCRATAGPKVTLAVHIGKKTPEPLASAPRVDFAYQVTAATAGFLGIVLDAPEGPLGTSDYRIRLEAAPLANAVAGQPARTFLHLNYAYSAGISARLAMQAYLATVARDKVGFTVTGVGTDGRAAYVGGVRAMTERNTMRYYLAIVSFLEFSNDAGPSQFESRLASWFTAAERYPRQLHDVERDAYMSMKRAEYLRQQSVN